MDVDMERAAADVPSKHRVDSSLHSDGGLVPAISKEMDTVKRYLVKDNGYLVMRIYLEALFLVELSVAAVLFMVEAIMRVPAAGGVGLGKIRGYCWAY